MNLLPKVRGRDAIFILSLVVLVWGGAKLGISERMLEIQFYSSLGVYSLLRVIELFRGGGGSSDDLTG